VLLIVFGSLMLMGAGTTFLYIFLSILVTGGYMAYEPNPNPFILWAEIAIGAVSFVVGSCLFRRTKYGSHIIRTEKEVMPNKKHN